MSTENTTVGQWIERFTVMEKSPRTARNAAGNRPYSVGTLVNYESYYRNYIKGEDITGVKMADVEEEDVLAFISKLSTREFVVDGNREKKRRLAGTRTFVGVIKLMRLSFNEYAKTHKRWLNPFQGLDTPKRTNQQKRDALTEDEVASLFRPGVLRDSMELAVCAVMFLAGLRRGEVFALRPGCLDWKTPKITVREAWQKFGCRDRVLSTTKSKKERDVTFDPILQNTIKKLWAENGQHEFVFCYKNRKTPGPSWIKGRFLK